MLVIFIFTIALIGRLILAPIGFHIDILSNAGWGQWIYLHGPLGFYENNVWVYSWPTQPPFVSLLYGFDNWLYIFLLQTFRSIGNTIVAYHLAPGHMRWWFNFTKWFDTAKTSDEASFSIGYLVSIKILPILADLGIAGLIYWVAKLSGKVKYPIIWASIFLFLPFSWYISSLWGQYDSLSFLPLLLAFILEGEKKFPTITPFLLAISIAIKPTSLILVPFFVYIYLKNKHNIVPIVFSAIFIAVFFFATTQVFTNIGIYDFTKNTLMTKIFFKAASRLSANAFNFWRILQNSGSEGAEVKFIFIPAYVWSILAYIILNLIAFKKALKTNLRNVFAGAFIISAGSWMFMTNMLDRYFYAGVVFGLIVCIYNPKIFKYWLIMSLIFAINLYNQWFFPPALDAFKNVLLWQNGVVTKILSASNVILLLLQLHGVKDQEKLQGE